LASLGACALSGCPETMTSEPAAMSIARDLHALRIDVSFSAGAAVTWGPADAHYTGDRAFLIQVPFGSATAVDCTGREIWERLRYHVRAFEDPPA